MARFASGAWLAAALHTVDLPYADIYLVGTGQRFPDDLSLATIAALDRSKTIFALPPVTRTSLDLPAMMDLRAEYGPGRPRRDTYRTMADLVLAAAVADPPVTFLTFGSSMVGALPAHTLLDVAPKAGLRVHVCGAPSFIEGILAELNVDPFDGLLIWDATGFLASRVAPPTNVDLLLAQPAFLNKLVAGPGATESAVRRLREHLLRHYDAHHPVCFVRVEETVNPGATEWMALCDLTDVPNDLSSLFVPRGDGPVRPARRAQRSGGRQVTTPTAELDLDALRELTRHRP